MSAQLYLNEASFPASCEDDALRCLRDLMKGINLMIDSNVIDWPFSYNRGMKISDLPLTTDRKKLGELYIDYKDKHMDIFRFFFQINKYNCNAGKIYATAPKFNLEDIDINNIKEFDTDYQKKRLIPIYICDQNSGILLSLGSTEQWRMSRVSFTASLVNHVNPINISCANVSDLSSAADIALESWNLFTNNADKSRIFGKMLDDFKCDPYLIAAIMCAVKKASDTSYNEDGSFIKKLRNTGDLDIYRVAITYITYNDRKDIRLLYIKRGGIIKYCFGGIKPDNSWYGDAIKQVKIHANR